MPTSTPRACGASGRGATVVAALREGGGDSGRDHGEVGVHGEGAWKAEAGQTCHGGGARRNTKAFKAWVDESAGGWDEGAFCGWGKLGLVLTLRSPPRRLDELCGGGRPRRVVPPPRSKFPAESIPSDDAVLAGAPKRATARRFPLSGTPFHFFSPSLSNSVTRLLHSRRSVALGGPWADPASRELWRSTITELKDARLS